MTPLPNLEALRAFAVVADAKQIKTAAERLGVTASAVSQSLSRLETELDCPLFVRNVRPLRLTPAGIRLLEDIRPIVAAAENLVRRPYSGDAESMRLRLGLSESVTATIAPWLVSELLGRVKELETETVFTKPLVEKLRDDQLDVAVSPDPVLEEDRWERHALYDEEFLLIAAGGETLPTDPLSLRAFAVRHPFIGYAGGSSDEIAMDRILRAMNVSPVRRVLVSSSYTLAGLVANAGGWSVVPPTNLWCGRQFLKGITFGRLPVGHRDRRRMWAVGDRQLSLEAVRLTAQAARRIFREKMLPELTSAAPGLDAFVTFPAEG